MLVQVVEKFWVGFRVFDNQVVNLLQECAGAAFEHGRLS